MTATATATATPFAPRAVATGEFRGADEFHFGEGTALLIETEPGVFVVLDPDVAAQFKDAAAVNDALRKVLAKGGAS